MKRLALVLVLFMTIAPGCAWTEPSPGPDGILGTADDGQSEVEWAADALHRVGKLAGAGQYTALVVWLASGATAIAGLLLMRKKKKPKAKA